MGGGGVHGVVDDAGRGQVADRVWEAAQGGRWRREGGGGGGRLGVAAQVMGSAQGRGAEEGGEDGEGVEGDAQG